MPPASCRSALLAIEGAGSFAVDAVHIARDTLVQAHRVIVRRREDREALRVLLTTRGNAGTARIQTVNQLKALNVSAAPSSAAPRPRAATAPPFAGAQPGPWSTS